MAITNNPFLDRASGTVGGIMSLYTRGDKTIIRRLRKQQTKPFTAAQLDAQDRFSAACLYARTVIKDPRMKAYYELFAKGNQSAYNLALKDALGDPVIEGIDATGYKGVAGDVICIAASDPYGLCKVEVTIYDDQGEVLESGDAQRDRFPMYWVYTARVSVDRVKVGKVVVVAEDMPGNRKEGGVGI